eukprot:7391900-Prymnesium_polylepis.2
MPSLPPPPSRSALLGLCAAVNACLAAATAPPPRWRCEKPSRCVGARSPSAARRSALAGARTPCVRAPVPHSVLHLHVHVCPRRSDVDAGVLRGRRPAQADQVGALLRRRRPRLAARRRCGDGLSVRLHGHGRRPEAHECASARTRAAAPPLRCHTLGTARPFMHSHPLRTCAATRAARPFVRSHPLCTATTRTTRLFCSRTLCGGRFAVAPFVHIRCDSKAQPVAPGQPIERG